MDTHNIYFGALLRKAQESSSPLDRESGLMRFANFVGETFEENPELQEFKLVSVIRPLVMNEDDFSCTVQHFFTLYHDGVKQPFSLQMVCDLLPFNLLGQGVFTIVRNDLPVTRWLEARTNGEHCMAVAGIAKCVNESLHQVAITHDIGN